MPLAVWRLELDALFALDVGDAVLEGRPETGDDSLTPSLSGHRRPSAARRCRRPRPRPSSSAAAAVLGQPAATAEVEAVDAGAEVGAAGLHAVPREHAHALVARALAHAAQRLDLAVGACRQGGSVAICITSGCRSRKECARAC